MEYMMRGYESVPFRHHYNRQARQRSNLGNEDFATHKFQPILCLVNWMGSREGEAAGAAESSSSSTSEPLRLPGNSSAY